MTHFYWTLRSNYKERLEKLSKMDRADIESGVINQFYNDFLSKRADYGKDEEDPRGHGKRLPYIGWFWRSLSFGHPASIPIGSCGNFIGFMANNKWDYPERCLTPDEFSRVIGYIDASIEASQSGGEMNGIIARTNKPLDDLWEYMQTLEVA